MLTCALRAWGGWQKQGKQRSAHTRLADLQPAAMSGGDPLHNGKAEPSAIAALLVRAPKPPDQIRRSIFSDAGTIVRYADATFCEEDDFDMVTAWRVLQCIVDEVLERDVQENLVAEHGNGPFRSRHSDAATFIENARRHFRHLGNREFGQVESYHFRSIDTFERGKVAQLREHVRHAFDLASQNDS